MAEQEKKAGAKDASAAAGSTAAPTTATRRRPEELRPVTLKDKHEHAGIEYQAGDVIEVNQPEEEFLRQSGKID